MSENNILLTATNEPLYRYAKAIRSRLFGKRLDPVTQEPIDFSLQTKLDDQFVYDDEVIEIYSEREHKYFLQTNKSFISGGFLKQYSGSAQPIDTINTMSDEEVERIAAIRTLPAVKKALSEVSSAVALDRILLMAKYIGRPQSVITLIEQRLTEV